MEFWKVIKHQDRFVIFLLHFWTVTSSFVAVIFAWKKVATLFHLLSPIVPIYRSPRPTDPLPTTISVTLARTWKKRSYAFYNNAHSANKGIGKEKGVSYSIYDVTIITHHQYRMYKRNGALVTTANVLQSLIKYVTPANMHNPIV